MKREVEREKLVMVRTEEYRAGMGMGMGNGLGYN